MSETEPLFSGTFTEMYDRYMVPLMFEHYAADLAQRVAVEEGARVLELACGTGAVTAALREALPDSVALVATDLSPDMLAHAEAKMPDRGAIEFRTADGTDLPFEDDTFDAVVCQFGVMFFPDKSAGYREALRVLKPNGKLLFSTWDAVEHNPLGLLAFETMAALMPDDPPVFMQAPFGYHDVDAIESELADAGFSAINIESVRLTSNVPSAERAALAVTRGTPVAPMLAERGLEPRAREALQRAFEDAFGAGPIEAPMQAIVVTAQRPE